MKDWRWEEKRTKEDEMVEWHHRLSGHEFDETPGVGDGQGGLLCCGPWGCKESDVTELNWIKFYHSRHNFYFIVFEIIYILNLRLFLFSNNYISRYYVYYFIILVSVQFSRSVMSYTLQPHESQHARPPCLLLQIIKHFILTVKKNSHGNWLWVINISSYWSPQSYCLEVFVTKPKMQQKPEAFVIAVFLKCITSGRTLKFEILGIPEV